MLAPPVLLLAVVPESEADDGLPLFALPGIMIVISISLPLTLPLLVVLPGGPALGKGEGPKPTSPLPLPLGLAPTPGVVKAGVEERTAEEPESLPAPGKEKRAPPPCLTPPPEPPLLRS
jgi:hypothetical protein